MDSSAGGSIFEIALKRIESEINRAKQKYGGATIYVSFMMSFLMLIALHLYLSWPYYIVTVLMLIAVLVSVGWILMLYLNRKIESLGKAIHLREKDEITDLFNSIKLHEAWRHQIKKLRIKVEKLKKIKKKQRTALKQHYHKQIKKLKKIIESKKMNLFVFFWLPGPRDKTGHASLVVLLDEFFKYTSHYPEQPVAGIGDPMKKLPTPAYNKPLFKEWRLPDSIIVIPNELLSAAGLNKLKIWADSRQRAIDNREVDFKLKFDNCCDTVKEALAQGEFRLENPIFRITTLGMSFPKLTEMNVLYTIALKYSHYLVRFMHSIYMLIVFVVSVPALEVIVQLGLVVALFVFIYSQMQTNSL